MANDLSVEALMELSLDDYIRVKNIKHPNSVPERSALSLSKFDRYRERDDDEEDDDGDVKVDTNAMLNDFDFMEQDKTDDEPDSASFFLDEPDSASVSTVYVNRQNGSEKRMGGPGNNTIWTNSNSNTNRVSVHDRLGDRPQNRNHRRNRNRSTSINKQLMKFTVQNRLNNDFANPMIAARNHMQRAGGEMIKTLAEKLMDEIKNVSGQNANEKKYNMEIQKEISSVQNKNLFYKCPGGAIVSTDGPGIEVNVVQNATGISLNQRFA